MVSVGTSIVPPGPCPPPADTPGPSTVVTTPQVTASIHDFAASLIGFGTETLHFGIQKASGDNDPPRVLTWQIGVTEIDSAIE